MALLGATLPKVTPKQASSIRIARGHRSDVMTSWPKPARFNQPARPDRLEMTIERLEVGDKIFDIDPNR